MRNSSDGNDNMKNNQMDIDASEHQLVRDAFAQTDQATFSDESTETMNTLPLASPSDAHYDVLNSHFTFLRPIDNHKKCLACTKSLVRGRPIRSSMITDMARFHCLLNHRIFIQSGSRCCFMHLRNGFLDDNSISIIKKHEMRQYEMQYEDLMKIFDTMKSELSIKTAAVEKAMNLPPLNFDEHDRFSSISYYILTGLTQVDFDRLCDSIPTWILRDSAIRSPRMAIACSLCKLRLGLSNRTLAVLFSFPDKRAVSRINNSVCSALSSQFVPKYIGFQHLPRETLLQEHTRPLARALFANDDPTIAILVLDGTYLYIQKSACHKLQRACYSMHKGRPLVKPMMVVSTTGYIVSAFGPYLANSYNNDARITEHFFLTNQEDIRSWLQPQDVLIVDRGFRDCLPLLNQLRFNVYMPAFLDHDKKQFDTNIANQTRFVTSVRWIVEFVNGEVKQWKMFEQVIPNTLLPKIGRWFKIVCALVNFSRPNPRFDINTDLNLAHKMLQMKNFSNELKKYIDRIAEKQTSSLTWQSIDATDAVPDFPRLSYEELAEITLGPYQLRRARCYVIEHLSVDGRFTIKVAKQRHDLIQAKIQSRYSNSKKHDVWLQYNSMYIEGWHCRCKVGSRNLGCCSHVASLMYYLGFARHNTQVLIERSSESFNHLIDAADLPDIDSESSETNSEIDEVDTSSSESND